MTEPLLPTPMTNYTATSAEEWRARRPAGNGGTRKQIGDLQLAVNELTTAVPATPTSTSTSPTTVPSSERSSGSRPLRVLDLFAGLGGWSAAFAARGHDVCTTDIDPRFDVTVLKDILELRREDLPWPNPDIILASPPCEGFTVMNIGKNWTKPTDDPPHAPKTELAEIAVKLVRRTRQIVEALEPRWFIIENPRAKLRQLPVVTDLERRTVWYCHMGETTAKPTDLWGGFPQALVLPAECHNQRADHPDDCCCRDHTSAPRGSRTPGSIQGVQGPDADALRAEVPYELSLAVCLAAEQDFEGGHRWTPTSVSSPGSAGSISPSKPSGSDASPRSSSTSTAVASSPPTGPTSNGSETLLPTPTAGDAKSSGNRTLPESAAHAGTSLTDALRPDRAGHLLTSSAEDSPASPSAKPDAAKRSTTRAGSGPSSPVLWMSYDRDGSSSRTSPDSSLLGWIPGPGRRRKDGRLLKSSRIWPTSGSMHDGSVFALPTLVPPTVESESSSSPIPEASTTPSDGSDSALPRTPHGMPQPDNPRHPGPTGNELGHQITQMLPTATSRDHKGPRGPEATPGDQLPDAIDKMLPMAGVPLESLPRGPLPHCHVPLGGKAGNQHQSGADLGPTVKALASTGEPTDPPSDDGSE